MPQAPPADSGYWWPKILGGAWNAAKAIPKSAWSGFTYPGDVATGKAHAGDIGRTLDMAGLVGGAGGAVPAEPGALNTFAGPLAKTADLGRLALAKAMAAKGSSPEDVIGATKWFQGADNKWRYEIPDQGASVKMGSGSVGDLVNHPELLNAYPQLGKVQAYIGRGDEPYATGSYDKTWPAMTVETDLAGEGAKPTALHELQHGVQHIEGFSPGANLTGGFDPYKRAAGEVEARNVEARSEMSPAQLAEYPPWMTQDIPNEAQTVGGGSGGSQLAARPSANPRAVIGNNSVGRVARDPAKMLTEALSSAQANIGGGKSTVAYNPATRSWDLAGGVQGALPTDAPLANGGRGAGLPPVAQTDLARQPAPRGVPQRTLDLTSDPNIRAQVMQHIQNGLQMSGGDWYDTTALRQRFHDLNGPEQGEQDFQKFMQYVGTNSPQNKVPPDIRQASYYYHLDKNGVPITPVDKFGNPRPEVQDPTNIAAPYKALPSHQSGSSEVQAGTRDPLDAQKTASFAQNLSGNYEPVTIDMHALKLPAMLKQDPRWLNGEGKAALASGTDIGTLAQDPKWWENSPGANEYGHLEQWWKGMANDLGITPAQAQAGSWVGGGHITGLGSDENKTFIDFMNDRGNLTAQKTGQGNAQDAIDAFIRGQQPLLTSGVGPVLPAYGGTQSGAQQPQPFPPPPPAQWQ